MIAPFPAPFAHPLATPRSLAARGVALRAATREDIGWLRTLYAESRAAELAPIPWPPAVKQRFLDSQFDLQHAHFVGNYPTGSFLIIERHKRPIGRLYLSNGNPELVVDICVSRAAQNGGIGSALLREVIERADQRGADVELHVLHHNAPAIRLYERLGLRIAGDPQGAHLLMRRTRGEAGVASG